jgi:hypothetical protein
LDYDDVVYPNAYTLLVQRLLQSTDVLAAGGVVRAQVGHTDQGLYVLRKSPWLQLGSSQADLLQNNFLPLHSFVIDTSRAQLPKPWFVDELIRLEDYDFLLRLAAAGTFDLSQLASAVCEYRLITRGAQQPVAVADFAPTNVNPLSNRDSRNLAAWQRARVHVDRTKALQGGAITSQAARAQFSAPPRVEMGGLSPLRWWRAVSIAIDQSGGLWSMLSRVVAMVRSTGVRGVLKRAISIVQRV